MDIEDTNKEAVLDELDQLRASANSVEANVLSELVHWCVQPRKDQRNHDLAVWMVEQIGLFATERGLSLDDGSPEWPRS